MAEGAARPANGQASPEVLFSCVAENTQDWFRRVETLALSIRRFGGALADSAIVVNFVGGVEPSFARGLEALDTEVRVVERFDARSVYANKLRMLELGDERSFDVLVGLDCDVVVVGDLTTVLPLDAIGAKPADVDVLTTAQWDALLHAVGLPSPAGRVTATTSGDSIYPYFNSGMVTVPHALCRRLLDRWSAYIADILALYETDEPIVPAQWRFHLDQFALACALANDDLPVRPLDVRLNFPTHLPVHPSALPASPEPLVIHYHRNVDANGFLLRARSPLADRGADAFNRARAAHLGLRYAGLARQPLRRRTRRAAVTGVRKILSRL
jgi:hypothetical protein